MTDAVTPTPTSAPLAPAVPMFPASRSVAAVLLFLGVTVISLTLDLGLKYWSFENVAGRPVVLTDLVREDQRGFWMQYDHPPTVVIPKVLHFQLTTNPGAVFGLGKGKRVVFIIVSAIATAAIFIMFARSPARAWLMHLALALILAGALGNLYDRLFYGVVRDMLHMLPGVHLPFGLAWPGGITEVWPWIFNIADVSLLVGVGLVLIATWRTETARKPVPPTPADVSV